MNTILMLALAALGATPPTDVQSVWMGQSPTAIRLSLGDTAGPPALPRQQPSAWSAVNGTWYAVHGAAAPEPTTKYTIHLVPCDQAGQRAVPPGEQVLSPGVWTDSTGLSVDAASRLYYPVVDASPLTTSGPAMLDWQPVAQPVKKTRSPLSRAAHEEATGDADTVNRAAQPEKARSDDKDRNKTKELTKPQPDKAQPEKDKPAAPPTDEAKKPPATDPIGDLDEMLGLGGKKPADGTPPEGPIDPSKQDLDRLLSGAEIGDAFRQAATLMGDAASRLQKHKDTSLTTQRMQEDIVRRLDQLISSLEQQQNQNSQQQQQQQQQSKTQQQNSPRQQQKDQNDENQGDNTGQMKDPPARRDGPVRPGLDAVRSAWGNLPDRIREMLVQGKSDRFSARYKELTEAYYRKLAEQGKAK
jgi:hypothetical protein